MLIRFHANRSMLRCHLRLQQKYLGLGQHTAGTAGMSFDFARIKACLAATCANFSPSDGITVWEAERGRGVLSSTGIYSAVIVPDYSRSVLRV
jgi:hypothetical protein